MRRHSKGAGAPPGLAAPSREVAVECDEWEIPSQPHFVLFDRLPRAALASTFVCVALFASTFFAMIAAGLTFRLVARFTCGEEDKP